MSPAKVISSVLGIGLMGKGSGTVAAALMCVLWYSFAVEDLPLYLVGGLLVLISILGVVASAKAEEDWGVDSNKIVIDEFAGMGITLFALPVDWRYIVAGFVLFRFFDIVKPLGIARAGNLPKGWGVMADDVLSGVYANLVLQIAALYCGQSAS